MRASTMVIYGTQLAEDYPPAREAFCRLRSQAGPAAGPAPAEERALTEWIVANTLVGEDDRTLRWFEEARSDAAASALVRSVDFLLERLLLERGRWADLAVFHPDALTSLARFARVLEPPAEPGLTSGQRQVVEEFSRDCFRTNVSRLYGAMIAAGRDGDASAVADAARRLDPAPELSVALTQAACDAGHARSPAGVRSSPRSS
jgi:hypothetical protein